MKRLVLVLTLMSLASVAGAAYVVGPGDVLQVTVWQRSDLDRTVPVRQDGFITFPPIGDIESAGLSTESLASRLEEQLFAFTRGATKVTVAVVEFHSKYVVLSGAVGAPGKYAFERIPGLFEVISIAGGAAAGARLSEVSILRTTPTGIETFQVNLAAYLQTGDSALLPPLQPGDVIFVPGAAATEALPGVATPGPSTIAILGAVGRPGTYEVQRSFSLPEVMGLAGGLTAEADLEEIKILSREPNGSEHVATLDLAEIFRAGEPVTYPIRPGDAIYVPIRRRGVLGTIATATLTAFSFSRDILNFAFVYDQLANPGGN